MANGQTTGVPVDLGANIRRCRERSAMSLRELARRVGISASALSQIETGKSQPSVNTLYEIVGNLEITLDELWLKESSDANADDGSASSEPAVDGRRLSAAEALATPHTQSIEFRPRTLQRVIDLEGDERMRQLGSLTLPGIDCMIIEYAPGSMSPKEGYSRHDGHEFNFLISGRLEVEVANQKFQMEAGDSLAFPSTEPHRICNVGDSTAEALTLFVHPTGSPPQAPPHR